MIVNGSPFRAFSEWQLSQELEARKARLAEEIKIKLASLSDDVAMKELIKKHQIEPIVFHEEKMTVSDREEQIPANWFPSGFFTSRGENYPKPVIRFHLPFSGNPRFLRAMPSTRLINSEDIELDGSSICFDVIKFSDDVSQINSGKDSVLRFLREQNSYVTREVEAYNNQLADFAGTTYSQVLAVANKHNDFMEKLGVPKKQD